MNFQATNLDGAYESLKSLNQLASAKGKNLSTGLGVIIGKLKSDWKGSDATLHINNLIDVYTGVATIVENVHVVAHNASKPIVDAQTIRNSNGGSGEVGVVFPTSEDSIVSIEKLGDTAEYYVDPTAAPQDLSVLQTLKETFDSFCTEFTSFKDELLNNWTGGADRDRVVSDFEQFEADAANYKKYFSEAEQTLSIAISNLKQI